MRFCLAVVCIAAWGCTELAFPSLSDDAGGGSVSPEAALPDGGRSDASGGTGIDASASTGIDASAGTMGMDGGDHEGGDSQGPSSNGSDPHEGGLDAGSDASLPDASTGALGVDVARVLATGVCAPVSVRLPTAIAVGPLDTSLSSGGFGAFYRTEACAAGDETDALELASNGAASVAYFKPTLAAGDYVAKANLTVSSTLGEAVVSIEVRRAAKEVAVGSGFACTVLDDGTVWCWGEREGAGQPRESGDFVIVAKPQQIPSISGANVHSLTAGWIHACVLVADSLRCWGRYGIRGPSDSEDIVITPAGMESGVTSLSAFHGQTCVVKDGGVMCWGPDGFDDTPTAVPGLNTNVVEVAVGDGHVCARLNDGKVKCRGRNESGQLGDGTKTHADTIPVEVASLDTASAIQTGAFGACAIANGRVRCWGDGVSVATQYSSDIVETLSMGPHNACTLSAGEPKCWGKNIFGEVGGGHLSVVSPPGVVPLDLPRPVTDIAAHYTSCAVARGLVYCWGGNADGELAVSTDLRRFPSATLVSPPDTEAITQVGLGALHSCMVAGGKAYCWGKNDFAALGFGTDALSRSTLIPKEVVGVADADAVAGTSNVKTLRVAPAGWTSCVITEAGSVKCWGLDIFEGPFERATAVSFAPGTKPSDVCVGHYHGCALVESPNPNPGVYCWGQNVYGQLGDGKLGAGSSTPVRVALPSPATAIACGESRACAVVSGGVRCWGMTDDDHVEASPVAVENLSEAPANHAPVVGVAIAIHKACALTDDGDVWCWSVRDAAEKVATDTTFDRIAGGGFRTFCGSAATGLWCWGSNDDGQLGNGNTIDASSPIRVPGVNAPIASFVTGVTSCAVDADGLKCWGSNFSRALGGDAPYYITKPVLTRGFQE